MTLLIIISLIAIPNHSLVASDTELPVTDISIFGNQGSNGIYFDSVRIETTSYDYESGVANIQYKINNGNLERL